MRSLRYDVADTGNDGGGVSSSDLSKLQQRVAELERELATVAAIAAHGDAEKTDPSRGRAMADAIWHCVKCSALLAFYDVRSDVLRIRYKDHMVYVRVGDGGFAQIICRGCGEINTQEYVHEAAKPGQPVEG